ncbi:MAG: prolyl oligopeptidase family serine peptidase [Leptolyngbya sp.]|nr:prolyl oligopeptidase family serine peptidase [Leptolyngbya sp.]
MGLSLGAEEAAATIVTVGLEATATDDGPPLPAGDQDRLAALQSVQRPEILSTLSPNGRTLLIGVASPLTPEIRTLHFLDLTTGTLTEAPELEYDVISPVGPVRWLNNDTLRFLQQEPFGPWEVVTLNRTAGVVSRLQIGPLGEESGEILGLSPDFSRLVIRVYGSEEAEDIVFLVALDGLQRLEVARLPQDTVLQSLAWSSDGQRLALVAAAIDSQKSDDRSPLSPSLASTTVQDALGRIPPADNPLRQRNWVRVFDLAQADPLKLELRADQDNGDSFADASLSPDGRHLLVKRTRPAHLAGRPYPTYLFPDSAYYQVYDLDGTLLHTIDDPAIQGPQDSQGWFLGPDRLLFWAAHGHNRPLWVYDLPSVSQADFSSAAIADPSGDLHASALRPLPLPPGSVDPAALALSPKGDTIIYGFSSVTQPPEIFRLRISDSQLSDSQLSDSRPPEPLTQINAALQEVNRVRYQPVEFRIDDGLRSGFLVQPAGQAFPPQGVPIVFWQEGGPGFSMANEFRVDVEAPLNLLPNFGLAVLVVPLTGREGFGPAFYRRQAEGQNFGFIDLAEGQTIIRQVVQQGWANPGQVGISGCSYGGYYTAQSLRLFPGLFAAANPQCSLLDTLTEWQTGYSGLLSYLIGHPPTEDPAAYLAVSPLYGSTSITTPTIMFHGTEDFLPIDVARNFHDILEAAGSPVTLYEFEGTGHGISDPQLQNLAAQLQIQFFRQYLTPTRLP